jgi:hypothetical protein
MNRIVLFSLGTLTCFILACAPRKGTLESSAQGSSIVPGLTNLNEIDISMVAAEIKTNMTFQEISKMIPLSINIRAYGGEHGGVWYSVPIGTKYLIKLRFEHPRGPTHPTGPRSISDCRLNYPPMLEIK